MLLGNKKIFFASGQKHFLLPEHKFFFVPKHIKALANKDTLLPTQMFPLFARARNICCGHKFCVRDTKMFLILFRNILCPQQMFPSFAQPKKHHGQQCVRKSATMCSRFADAMLTSFQYCSLKMFPRNGEHTAMADSEFEAESQEGY